MKNKEKNNPKNNFFKKRFLFFSKISIKFKFLLRNITAEISVRLIYQICFSSILKRKQRANLWSILYSTLDNVSVPVFFLLASSCLLPASFCPAFCSFMVELYFISNLKTLPRFLKIIFLLLLHCPLPCPHLLWSLPFYEGLSSGNPWLLACIHKWATKKLTGSLKSSCGVPG